MASVDEVPGVGDHRGIVAGHCHPHASIAGVRLGHPVEQTDKARVHLALVAEGDVRGLVVSALDQANRCALLGETVDVGGAALQVALDDEAELRVLATEVTPDGQGRVDVGRRLHVDAHEVVVFAGHGKHTTQVR